MIPLGSFLRSLPRNSLLARNLVELYGDSVFDLSEALEGSREELSLKTECLLALRVRPKNVDKNGSVVQNIYVQVPIGHTRQNKNLSERCHCAQAGIVINYETKFLEVIQAKKTGSWAVETGHCHNIGNVGAHKGARRLEPIKLEVL